MTRDLPQAQAGRNKSAPFRQEFQRFSKGRQGVRAVGLESRAGFADLYECGIACRPALILPS
jgi:hypothetical protein